ncbi:uncharacterized protein LOC143149653 [Ptiloglossa arizonensis]|uniref:uncharacterized protein LOC143149653 n=1 Tax=Ptiloglossa arizonensis TaxID=3350558 RepID=UPI003F9F99F2
MGVLKSLTNSRQKSNRTFYFSNRSLKITSIKCPLDKFRVVFSEKNQACGELLNTTYYHLQIVYRTFSYKREEFRFNVTSSRQLAVTQTEPSTTNMNSFIVLCFLATLCAMQVVAYGPLDQLRQYLERSKSDLKMFMSNTQRTRDNLYTSTEMQLNDMEYRQMSSVNSYVDQSLAQIRSDVDAAKAKGKNVENCYTTAQNSFQNYRQAVLSAIQTCQTNGQQSLVTSLSPLDAVQQTGNQYLAQLDNVFLKCYSSDVQQMQNCIVINLGTINVSIRKFESNINNVKQNVNSNVNNVVLTAFTCNMNSGSSIYSNATTAIIAASQCIKN